MSFDIAVKQLGGSSIILSPDGIHYGKGDETLKDTAKVLTEYVDIVMLRTSLHKNLEEFGKYLGIPIINGLSDTGHPCQIISDILTFEENNGLITNKTISWLGDGNNNMSNSLIEAAGKFNFNLKIGCPKKYSPNKNILVWAKKNKAKFTETAKNRIKTGLILNEFGEQNKIQVTEQEIQAEVQKQLRMMPGQEKMVMDFYQKNPSAVASLRGTVYEEKILNLIKEKAKPNKKEISKEEAEKILKEAHKHDHNHDHDHDHGKDKEKKETKKKAETKPEVKKKPSAKASKSKPVTKKVSKK